MKALLITVTIAFLLSLLSVASATTAPDNRGKPAPVPTLQRDEPRVPTRAGNHPTLPSSDVGSINDEVGTNSLTHPERDGREAGSINDTDGIDARKQRAAEAAAANRHQQAE